MDNILWLTWEVQVRNHSLSKMLGAELIEIVKAGKVGRYLFSSLQTIKVLYQKKPQLVVVQNPSIVLNLLLLLLRPVFKYVLVSDAHYGGIKAFNNSPVLQRVLDYVNSNVDLVIVTNSKHLSLVENLGGRAILCQDPLPTIPDISGTVMLKYERSVLLICAYAIDEPFSMVFHAFEKLAKEGYTCFVSGNYKRAGIDPNDYPHINFLGYVSYEEYWRHIICCDVIVDLTDWDDCLVCGAYEAMAAGKATVLSDTPALREFFKIAAVYTTNQSEDLVEKITQAYLSRDELQIRVKNWRRQNEVYMHDRQREIIFEFQKLIN